VTIIAQTGTGTAGTVIIDDNGSTVSFIVKCTNSATNTSGNAWSGNINGVNVGGTFNFPAGAGQVTVASYTVSSNTTATFTMGATGTSGLGGPATAGPVAVNRATVPPAPTTPACSLITGTTMRVSFSSQGTGGAAVDQWQLQRATDAGFTANVVTITSNGTSDITGLTKGTRYYWRARGHNAVGWGGWSGTGNAITLIEPSKPAAPTVSSTTSSTATLAYVDPSNGGAAISSRTFQYSTDPTFATGVLTANPTASPFTISGLSRNTLYYGRIKMTNSVGDSAWSDTANIQIPGAPPSAPTGYTLYDVTSTSATCSLGSIADNGGAAPSQVRIKVSTTASDVGLVNTITQDTWSPIFLTGLTLGTTYYVAQAAFNTANGGGWGAYGAWTAFTTLANVPNAPALSLNTAGSTTATLQWAAPTALNGATINSYTLRIASNKAMTANVRDITVIGSLSQVVDQLTPATTYYAQVWTETNNGKGSASPVLQFATTGGGGSTNDLWLNVATVWKNGELWVNVAGVWKSAELWVNVAGVWKQAL
jgi:hypothetical protein